MQYQQPWNHNATVETARNWPEQFVARPFPNPPPPPIDPRLLIAKRDDPMVLLHQAIDALRDQPLTERQRLYSAMVTELKQVAHELNRDLLDAAAQRQEERRQRAMANQPLSMRSQVPIRHHPPPQW